MYKHFPVLQAGRLVGMLIKRRDRRPDGTMRISQKQGMEQILRYSKTPRENIYSSGKVVDGVLILKFD